MYNCTITRTVYLSYHKYTHAYWLILKPHSCVKFSSFGVHHTFGSPFWLQYTVSIFNKAKSSRTTPASYIIPDAIGSRLAWFPPNPKAAKAHRLEQNHYLPQTTRTVKSGCPATIGCHVACRFGTGLELAWWINSSALVLSMVWSPPNLLWKHDMLWFHISKVYQFPFTQQM